MLLYMAILNLVRLTTFSVGTVARMVSTVTSTIAVGWALTKSDYYTLSHYAPEFEESKSEWLTYHETELSESKTKKALLWLSTRRVFVGFIAGLTAAIELLRVRA